MGDDPLPAALVHADATSGQGGSAATGGSVVHLHSGLSSNGQLAITIIACLALGLSVGGVVVLIQGRITTAERIAAAEARLKDAVEAAEKRAMDRSTLAEREARIAQDKIDTLTVELGKQKIFVRTDGH